VHTCILSASDLFIEDKTSEDQPMKNVLHATSVPRPADHPNGGLLAGTTPGADGRSNRGDGSISVSPLSASAMAEADASRRGDYQAYINSHAWKTSPARMGELEAAGYRCRICNRSVDEVRLEVHHRTYENFGREVQADLTALCSDCHLAATSELRNRRYAARIPHYSDVPPVDPRMALFDPTRRGEWS
jgi:hypothetical protein